MNDFILGVDLAQSQDYTALTILERTELEIGQGAELKRRNDYQAQYLERLPKGTAYPAQVDRIKQLYDELKKTTQTYPALVVDQTGVGRPVVDMLSAAGLSPIAVTITGGDNVSQDRDNYRVPKRNLATTVAILLQSDRLKIARALPEASTLTAELLAFKVSVSLKGHDSYGNDVGPWRENPHDDMVLAVALAVWYGEHSSSHAPQWAIG